jgi:hypothetical protein
VLIVPILLYIRILSIANKSRSLIRDGSIAHLIHSVLHLVKTMFGMAIHFDYLMYICV